MNKAALAAKIAEKTGMKQKDAKAFLQAYTDTVIETLKAGEKVQMMGFGNFELRERAARKAFNPRTGESVEVAAKKVPVFVAGKGFKDEF